MSRARWTVSAVALLATGCRLAAPLQPALAPASSAPTAIAATAAATAAESAGATASDLPTDAEFWRMSRDAAIAQAGRAAFSASSCRTCHGLNLTGGAAPNLIDQRWLHGGTPREVYGTITRGVPSKGMPTWGPVLGPKTIAALVAYIFSYHREGEPIEAQASFTPFTPSYEIP